jgi:hypothetical protein
MSKRALRVGAMVEDIVKMIEARVAELRRLVEELEKELAFLENLRKHIEGMRDTERKPVRRYPIYIGGEQVAEVEWDGEVAVARFAKAVEDSKKVGFIKGKWRAREKLEHVTVDVEHSDDGKVAALRFANVKTQEEVDKIKQVIRWLLSEKKEE